jgi:hypothetical protein
MGGWADGRIGGWVDGWMGELLGRLLLSDETEQRCGDFPDICLQFFRDGVGDIAEPVSYVHVVTDLMQ